MRTTQISSRPMRAAVATGAAALVLTACGGGDDPTVAGGGSTGSSGSGQSASSSDVAAANNEADIAFITDMKPHHEGALEMAELAATRAQSPQVKDLASRIVAAQDPEIQRMQEMAAAWNVDLDAGPQGGMDMSGSMSGGMSGDMAGDMAALEPLSGTAFDREFLTRMTAHHQSAVEMSRKEIAEGENPQAKELAQQIVAAQTEEIAEMKTLLAGL